jgi:microcystin degradation protein MlrC
VSGLFIAGLDTESNSFSPIPTDEAAKRIGEPSGKVIL